MSNKNSTCVNKRIHKDKISIKEPIKRISVIKRFNLLREKVAIFNKNSSTSSKPPFSTDKSEVLSKTKSLYMVLKETLLAFYFDSNIPSLLPDLA